jgi:hypothetical protein
MMWKRLPSRLRLPAVLAGLRRLGATLAPIKGMKAPRGARWVASPVPVRVAQARRKPPTASARGWN